MNLKNTLILSGLGLNCEKETEYACQKSGAGRVDIVHIVDFLAGKVNLDDYGFLICIGGFMDGDYLGSARVNVNRFKYGASEGFSPKEALQKFVAQKRLVLGICNGFQFLVKLGMLPDDQEAFATQSCSLTQNNSGQFEDRWVYLKVNPNNPSPFLQGITQMYLPIRHGEGKIVPRDAEAQANILKRNLAAMFYADEQGQPTADYPYNPNGSWNNIAALSNQQGNVFGLMPHPEAYNHYTNHPHWTRLTFTEEDGEGLKLFKNAYRYLGSLQ